ncbi:MAG: SRPBCC family protein [Polyangiaceae bacterium]
MSQTDRIEKKIVLKAPRARVWRAISDSSEFGTWFRAKVDGPFVPGKRASGRITYPGYEHLTFEVDVQRMEPETLLSLRWHPSAIDPKVDYSKEPTTLVEIRLAEVAGGTELTIIESGFDALPADRRETAWRSNEGGWQEQLGNIERHVAG